MSDESRSSGIDADELEAQAGEPLPDREAMSLISLDDGGFAVPPENEPHDQPASQ